MAAEVEVAAVVDALELLPAEGEAVLHVDGLLGVVRQLVGGVLAEAQPRGRDAVALVPRAPCRQPLLEGRRGRLAGGHEVLHLHLLELAHPEDEVARADLVAEGLADLGDAEGHLPAAGLLHGLEVDVRALRRLGAQVDDGGLVLDRAHVRLEHEVEAARRRERPRVHGADEAESRHDALVAELAGGECLSARQLVEPEAAMAGAALHERIGEGADVPGGDPHLGVHEDARVEAHDVVALLDHGPPPGALDVVLELDAERAVVPDRVDAAVDLRGREDEAAALGQRDDGVEVGDGGAGVGRLGVGARRRRARRTGVGSWTGSPGAPAMAVPVDWSALSQNRAMARPQPEVPRRTSSTKASERASRSRMKRM